MKDPAWKNGPPEGREMTITMTVTVQIESHDPDEDGSETERAVAAALRAAHIDADTEITEVTDA